MFLPHAHDTKTKTKRDLKPTPNTARRQAVAPDSGWGLFPTPSSLHQMERWALEKGGVLGVLGVLGVCGIWGIHRLAGMREERFPGLLTR